MLLMDYPFIRKEKIPDYSKKDTWNLLHYYMDENIQIIFDECPWDRVQAISIIQSQYANMTFFDQIR